MPTTTIKVESDIRDRLARLARIRRITMGALLGDVVDRLETEQRWSEINEAYDRLQSQDPAGWADYLGELAAWQIAVTTDDASLPEEWPEYNG
jgi:hypothetical protein